MDHSLSSNQTNHGSDNGLSESYNEGYANHSE
jgi:hypothetical protein